MLCIVGDFAPLREAVDFFAPLTPQGRIGLTKHRGTSRRTIAKCVRSKIDPVKNAAPVEVLFTRSSASVGKSVEQFLRAARTSIEAALYRLSQPRLARAIHDAARRGVRVRVILDRQKYELTPATQRLLAQLEIPYRLMSGRRGHYAKMHHKFAVVDGHVALTGSYNWTEESEENNYEGLAIIRDPVQVARFAREFEALWAIASKRGRPHKPQSRGPRLHETS